MTSSEARGTQAERRDANSTRAESGHGKHDSRASTAAAWIAAYVLGSSGRAVPVLCSGATPSFTGAGVEDALAVLPPDEAAWLVGAEWRPGHRRPRLRVVRPLRQGDGDLRVALAVLVAHLAGPVRRPPPKPPRTAKVLEPRPLDPEARFAPFLRMTPAELRRKAFLEALARRSRSAG